MKKTLFVLLLFTFGLSAADFWQSKPWTEWTAKDLTKMMSDSPWARGENISLLGPIPPNTGDAAGNSGVDPGAPTPISEGGGGRGGRGGRGNAGVDTPSAGPGITVVARWQSALPMKQALAKLKYGSEAATSPDAKQAIEHEETSYIILLTGPLRGLMHGDPETMKQSIAAASSLSAKGKGAARPSDVQIRQAAKAVDVVFYFSRSAAYTAGDKEVEFSTKIGDTALKYKFRLRDMVYQGKLAL